MEVSGLSTQFSQNMMNGLSSISSSQESSLMIITNDDDEDKKTIIMMQSSNMQGIASEHYRDSLGRPAIGTYDMTGAIQGSLTSLGTSLNITA